MIKCHLKKKKILGKLLHKSQMTPKKKKKRLNNIKKNQIISTTIRPKINHNKNNINLFVLL